MIFDDFRLETRRKCLESASKRLGNVSFGAVRRARPPVRDRTPTTGAAEPPRSKPHMKKALRSEPRASFWAEITRKTPLESRF